MFFSRPSAKAGGHFGFFSYFSEKGGTFNLAQKRSFPPLHTVYFVADFCPVRGKKKSSY
jgi:hypothetical protein